MSISSRPESKTEKFGPFAEVPSEMIHPVGFDCKACKHPVRRYGAVVPWMIPPVMLYACQCGAVVVWEDETQPGCAQHWAQNIKLIKKSGVEVVVFNGNKRTPPDFSGIN